MLSTRTHLFMALVALAGIALAASLLVLFASGKPVQAAFPGTNGKIAFHIQGRIYTMDPNGSSFSAR